MEELNRGSQWFLSRSPVRLNPSQPRVCVWRQRHAEKYKRKEHCDSETVEEFDILPTRKSGKICVLLTADERAEDLVNLPCCLEVLLAPV